MSHGELFIQILSEASGKSRDFALAVVEEIKSSLHGQDIFDVEMSETEADKLLSELRNEKQLIVRWLLEGYYRALVKSRFTQGSA